MDTINLETFSAGPLENLCTDFIAHYKKMHAEDPDAWPLELPALEWEQAFIEFAESYEWPR